MTQTASSTTRALGFATLDEERPPAPAELDGQLPTWLHGTFVRATPALFDVGDRSVGHWFDGAAMLNAFTLADGAASYACRFLDTGYHRDMRRGRLGAPVTMATDPCRRFGSRLMTMVDRSLTANTNVNVYRLGERYVAATELPVPLEFDPDTLATRGPVRLSKRRLDEVHGPFAHPHFDVQGDGALIAFVTRVSPRGGHHRIVRVVPGSTAMETVGTVPTGRNPGYMHSFALTERSIVLVEQPLTYDVGRILRTSRFQDGYRWHPDRGTRFVVVDRASGRIRGEHATEASFHWHQLNAFERDGEIVVDLIAADDASSVWDLDLDKLRDPGHHPRFGGEPRRYVLPLDGGEVSARPLADIRMEFPRIAYERVSTRPYRWAYGIAYAGEDSAWFDELVKLDVDSGDVTRWAEPGCHPSEPVFTPRPGGTDEDDGAILSVVLDTRAERSFLLVLDARDLTELARVEAPHAIPFNFHQDYFPRDGGSCR